MSLKMRIKQNKWQVTGFTIVFILIAALAVPTILNTYILYPKIRRAIWSEEELKDFTYQQIFNFLEVEIGSSVSMLNKPCDALISKVGTVYFSLNGTMTPTSLIFWTLSLEKVMEWSWGNLSRGGVMYTHGPGHQWVLSNTINSQAANITWRSDPSVQFIGHANLDGWFVDVTHADCTFEGISYNGNKGGGNTGGGFALRAGADRVKLRDFRFYDVDYINIQLYDGVDIATIEDGYILQPDQRGIHIGTASHVNIRNVMFQNLGGEGIFMDTTNRVKITECIFEDLNLFDGIYIAGGWDITISLCQFRDGEESGIHIVTSGAVVFNVILAKNLFNDIMKGVIYLYVDTYDIYDVTIDGNIIENCTHATWLPDGIHVEGKSDGSATVSRVTITNNLISRISGVGICFFRFVYNSTIGPNTLYLCKGGGIEIDTYCNDTSITGITIIGVYGNSEEHGEGIQISNFCYRISIVAGIIMDIKTDGIIIENTCSLIVVQSVYFGSIGGDGVEIAAANCVNNVIRYNIFDKITGANVNDAGTGTVTAGNQGI